MRKWLPRFAFSLIVLAAVCAWEGYKIRRGDLGPGLEWKEFAFFAGAVALFVLGLFGMRERHRPPDDDDTNLRP